MSENTIENIIQKLGIPNFNFSSPNAIDSYGNNALILLIRNGFLESAKEAIRKGVNLNYISSSSNSPLKTLYLFADSINKNSEISEENKNQSNIEINDLVNYIKNYGTLDLKCSYMDGKTNEQYITLILQTAVVKDNNQGMNNQTSIGGNNIPN